MNPTQLYLNEAEAAAWVEKLMEGLGPAIRAGLLPDSEWPMAYIGGLHRLLAEDEVPAAAKLCGVEALRLAMKVLPIPVRKALDHDYCEIPDGLGPEDET